jgi:hypothetical protein
LLEEVPRDRLVDQDRRAGQQHVHVRAELVGGVVAVAGAQALRDRLGHRLRRAGGLGQDNRRLGGDGASPVLDLAKPDQLIDHQQRDQQHEQSRHRVGSERVTGPPTAHRLVGDLTDHQSGSEQRGDGRREPPLPT